jgi:hypothetical protein
MRVERRVVAIDLIDEHFRIVLARCQDLELQGPGLVFQGTSAVRHQQRQELIAPTRRDFIVAMSASFGIPESPRCAARFSHRLTERPERGSELAAAVATPPL